jgi:hypothetical protein
MNNQILLWGALALIAAGVVALNVWDHRRRNSISAEQRKEDDDKLQERISEGW